MQETRCKEKKARCMDIKFGTVEAETKKWCGNHIEKEACGQGSGSVEGDRQDKT